MGGISDSNKTTDSDRTEVVIADETSGNQANVITGDDSNKRVAADVQLRGRDGTHVADVVLEGGIRRLQTTAQATITGGLFGRTVFPSTTITIDTAPTSGDQLRIQIPDDSVDVTTTFATEGLVDAATRIVDDLNSDSNFFDLYSAETSSMHSSQQYFHIEN